ncbi:MAG: hypothetical protein WB392_15060 [Methanotrichaceae archaeon]
MPPRKGIRTTFKEYIEGFPYYVRIIQDYVQPASVNRLQIVRDMFRNLLDQKGRDIEWEIDIPKGDSLKFKDIERNGNRLEVQLSCKIKGIAPTLESENLIITEYKTQLWIRSLEKKLSFRPKFDSRDLCHQLSENDWKRVILSFHVDFRDPNTRIYEPIFHLHVGGRLEEKELCWIPNTIEEPRFYFFPLDVVLLSEFILLNYRPEVHDELRKQPEWTKRIIYSQNLYLKPYVLKVYNYLDDNNYTLLNHLAQCY